jgi:hypothetical protein
MKGYTRNFQGETSSVVVRPNLHLAIAEPPFVRTLEYFRYSAGSVGARDRKFEVFTRDFDLIHRRNVGVLITTVESGSVGCSL